MFNIGQLVGAFIITFLLSRLALYLLRRWDGGTNKLAAAHGGTLAVSWVLSAFGHADGGPPDWSAGIVYAVPVVVWFVVDLVRRKGGAAPKKEAA